MPTSLTIDNEELQRLHDYILEKDIRSIPIKSKYELLRLKDGKISIIVYKSMKVVHNDTSDSKQVINSILRRDVKYDYIVGSDETGKGEWYGPLVVVSTALTPEQIIKFREIGVRDSKSINSKELFSLAKSITNHNIIMKELTLMPAKYNELYEQLRNENKTLNDLLAWAHSIVIKDVLEKIESCSVKIVIDKFDQKKTDLRLERKNILKKDFEIVQKSKGESEISVAAASILAKQIYESKLELLNHQYKLDLKNTEPEDIDPELLPKIAKLHFKNIQKLLPKS